MSEPTAEGSGKRGESLSERAAKDSRTDPRHAVDLHVSLQSEDNFYSGSLENLSASGVFVATHTLREVGERVRFSIRLGEAEETLDGVGQVRWLRQYSETSDAPPGMGLRFIELSAQDLKRVDEFLRNREPLFFDDEGA